MVLVFCSFFSRFILILNTFLSVGISKRKSFPLLLCWYWIPFLFGEHIAVGTWKQSLWSLVLVWCPSLSGLSCLLSAVSVRWSCDYSLVQVMISTVLWVYLFSLSLWFCFLKNNLVSIFSVSDFSSCSCQVLSVGILGRCTIIWTCRITFEWSWN